MDQITVSEFHSKHMNATIRRGTVKITMPFSGTNAAGEAVNWSYTVDNVQDRTKASGVFWVKFNELDNPVAITGEKTLNVEHLPRQTKRVVRFNRAVALANTNRATLQEYVDYDYADFVDNDLLKLTIDVVIASSQFFANRETFVPVSAIFKTVTKITRTGYTFNSTDRPIYNVLFDDGSGIVADGSHTIGLEWVGSVLNAAGLPMHSDELAGDVQDLTVPLPYSTINSGEESPKVFNYPVVNRLLNLKVDDLGPLDAMTKLYELQRLARETPDDEFEEFTQQLTRS